MSDGNHGLAKMSSDLTPSKEKTLTIGNRTNWAGASAIDSLESKMSIALVQEYNEFFLTYLFTHCTPALGMQIYLLSSQHGILRPFVVSFLHLQTENSEQIAWRKAAFSRFRAIFRKFSIIFCINT